MNQLHVVDEAHLPVARQLVVDAPVPRVPVLYVRVHGVRYAQVDAACHVDSLRDEVADVEVQLQVIVAGVLH